MVLAGIAALLWVLFRGERLLVEKTASKTLQTPCREVSVFTKTAEKNRIEKLNHLMEQPLNWVIKDIHGEVIDFYCIRKIILLNFWATWCPPCIQELASLSELADRYKEDIFVIAVSSEDMDTIKNFLNRSFGALSPELKFASVEEKEQLKYFPKDKLPVTYIFNGKGFLKVKEIGFRDWSDKRLIQSILKLY